MQIAAKGGGTSCKESILIDMVNRCGFEPYISHISFITYSSISSKKSYSTSKTIDPLCFWCTNPQKNVDILQFPPRDVHLEIPVTQQRWRTNRLHHVVLLGRCPNWTPVFCCKKRWIGTVDMDDSNDFHRFFGFFPSNEFKNFVASQ